jgi:hypothetical protein
MTGDKVAIISVEAAVRRNEGTGDGSGYSELFGPSLGRSFSVDDYHVVSNLMSLI